MGWEVGFDDHWQRDIGYGVPCECDHPDCKEEINRGLSRVCGGEPYGGDEGCGLFFCGKHLSYFGIDRPLCERCGEGGETFDPKPDVTSWLRWKLRDMSWLQWRKENPKAVDAIRSELKARALAAQGKAKETAGG